MDWAPVDWLLVKYHAEWKWVYQTASFHLVSAPANYAGKQQTTYLFAKENIHQATVEDEVKPIWRHCKVTFLSEVGEFSAEGWRDYGGTYWIPVLKSQVFKDKLYSLENRLASWWKASSYLLWLGHTGVKIGWQPACDYEKNPQNMEVFFFFLLLHFCNWLPTGWVSSTLKLWALLIQRRLHQLPIRTQPVSKQSWCDFNRMQSLWQIGKGLHRSAA